MRILFIADVFGAPGRRAVEARLPSLRDELGADFCVLNGENAAAGRGITAKLADRLLAAGADVITLGNWTWGQPGFAPYLSGTDRVLRPANMSPQTPGIGLAVHDGVAVISLLGVFSLDPFESPFLAADRLVEEARRETPVVVVDFHAEATSEKVALARYLDGRATAVLGTHTHVQTNDARVGHAGAARAGDRRRAYRGRARRVHRRRARDELHVGSRQRGLSYFKSPRISDAARSPVSTPPWR